jgi:hypothetical protein
MPNPIRVTAAVLAALAFAGALSCRGGEATAPAPTTHIARIVSPFQDDGAALVEFAGDFQSATAPTGTTLFVHRPGSGVTRVLLVREAPGAMELTLQLAPGASRPVGTVLEVSDGQDQPREDLSGYKVQY